MSGKWLTDVKVGVFVVVLAVTLAIGVSLVGKFRLGEVPGYTVTVRFETVSGLEEKSPVRIAGVRMGEVERITLDGGTASVVMRLQPGAVIRDDSEITISSLGLLGEKYVEITAGSPERAAVSPGQTVRGKETVSMDRLFAQFADIAADIKSLTSSLRAYPPTGEPMTPLQELLSNFNSMVAHVDGLVQENRQGIKGAVRGVSDLVATAQGTLTENREDIRQAVKNFRQLSADLATQTKNLGDRLNALADKLTGTVDGVREDLSGTMREVKEAAASVRTTVDSMRGIVEGIRRGEGTVGKLLTDDAAYRNLNQTLDSVARISERIEKGEGTFGKLMTDDAAYKSFTETMDGIRTFVKKGEETSLHVGFRSEYLTEHEDYKNYVTLRISPRGDKYYLIEAVDDPVGKRSVTETTTTSAVDGRHLGTITTLEEQYENKLKFSLQMARRFSDLTLRAGLTESTGGLGLDYDFAEGKGKYSLDIFDFDRRESNPHLKLGATYRIYHDFFLTAGVDDVLEEGRRSFYAGGGILFSDDDIKYLYGLINLGQ